MKVKEHLIESVHKRGIWKKNFKGLNLSINQCELHFGRCLGDIMDTLYSYTFHLVKKFCPEGRRILFCHWMNLSRGTWLQDTSLQIEPKSFKY